MNKRTRILRAVVLLAQSEFTQLVNTALAVADVHGFADESSEV